MTTPELLLETQRLRATLPPRGERTDIPVLRRLSLRLKASRSLRREPAVQAFLDDVDDSLRHATPVRLRRTKARINRQDDHRIFSLFDTPCFPALSLELLCYRPLWEDDTLAARYPSRITPVMVERASAGFAPRLVVALFPENHVDHLHRDDDLVFYFIDKFIARHHRVTQPMLRHVVAEGDLPRLRGCSRAQVQRAAVHWVRLHEHHHHAGPLRLRAARSLKRLKPLAGLEELRVDVAGMLCCLGGSSGLAPAEAEFTYQFILAERLLRHAVEGIPTPNHDAVASQVLFDFLLRRGGIRVVGRTLHLCRQLPDRLADFAATVDAIESGILQQPGDRVQQQLLGFVNEHAAYDTLLGRYRHMPFFEDIKRRLRL